MSTIGFMLDYVVEGSCDVVSYISIDSTNQEALRLCRSGAYRPPFVVVSDTQTAGRGRHGREWYSDAKGGLYYTLCLRPDSFERDQLDTIYVRVSGVISETIESVTGIRATFKAPNDLYVSGKKLCGTLFQTTVRRDVLESVVVGIGLNVNQDTFPEPLSNTATSLYLETGRLYDLSEFVRLLTKELIHVFERH